ncbi:MAG: ABC transporter ATP-binding protein [Dehalococcoidia bacterium]|nr:ABC transporter ATP-binding protein [Dehalococcoidia bacterium]MSQ34486.1 ABC transporter ATP-binding protein [Dehalococcoidia bacterium]
MTTRTETTPELPPRLTPAEAVKRRRAAALARRTQGEQVFGVTFDGRVFSRFISFLKPYRRQLIIAILAVLAATGSSLAFPILVRFGIDHAISAGGDRRLLAIIVGILAGFVTLNFLFTWVQDLVVARVAQKLLFDLRGAMYAHLQRVSLSFMDKTEVGRLMSRLQGDVASLQEFLETSVYAIGDLVTLLGITVVLLIFDWRLGVLCLAVVPSLFLVRIVWLPFAKKAFLRARVTSSIMHGALNENVNGVRVVQGAVRERVNLEFYDELTKDNLQAQLWATKIGQVLIPIVDLLTGGALAVVIVVGGTWVLHDELEIGVMVMFILYVQRFFEPIRALTMHYNVLQRAMASGQRIFEVLDVPVDVKDKPGALVMKDIDPSIEFKNVTFGYYKDQPVLKGISFKVKPGETVALVGPTGSGKTSCTALLHRFYDIWEGQILVGGHDVRDVTQESLGHQVAMVLQDPYLFSGTVYDNIRYNKDSATREQVETAATAVGAHEFILKLPQGYDTVLEQRGGNLSLGQRQLVSFARAIVADAKILVLDEATASIDSYTEMQIQRALKTLLEGRTGVVIAHRLATIRGADRIIVLQDGMIIEEGRHDQLMDKRGLYARLYSLNYSSFDDIPDDLVKQAVSSMKTGT